MSNFIQDLFSTMTAQVLLTLLVTFIIQMVLRESIQHIVERIVKGHKHTSRAEERQREQTLIRVFRTASAVLLWITAVVVVLYQLHVNVAALLTGAGVFGVIVGFGAQNAIKDYLAGLFIIMENQYRVGDIVTLYADGANISGMVDDISLRITKLRDLDGNLHIVQNGSGGVVTNRSFTFANVNVDIGVAYDSDLEKVRGVIDTVGAEQAKHGDWRDEIIEPIEFLRVDAFGDHAVIIKAIGKVQPAKQWDVAGDFRLRLKNAFDKAGIVIPLPQVVVHQAQKSS
ncbi:hypothetical protein BH09PAT4_BH09PAT4_06640 [soil metagenome]